MKRNIALCLILLLVSSLFSMSVEADTINPTVELTYTNTSSNNYNVTVKLKGITTSFMSAVVVLNYDNNVLKYSSHTNYMISNKAEEYFGDKEIGKLSIGCIVDKDYLSQTGIYNAIGPFASGEVVLCTVSFVAKKSFNTSLSIDSAESRIKVHTGVDVEPLLPYPISATSINIPVSYIAPTPIKNEGTGGGGGGGGSGVVVPVITPVATPANTFIDLDGYDWASPAIYNLFKLGIIKGTSENTFSPENNITRADFAVLLSRTFNLKSDVTDNFSDIPANEYFYKPIGILKSLGIAQGDGDNYRPYEPITRQDIIVLTHRALSLLGNITDTPDFDMLNKFEDKGSIADYATGAVCVMVGRGIIKGNDGNLAPLNNATRAESAVIFNRIYDIIPK